jgi:hypothetical protein
MGIQEMNDNLRALFAAAAAVETLQFRMDAANLALGEAAQAALTSGAATLADVRKATGLSRTELLHLLQDCSAEPFILKSA